MFSSLEQLHAINDQSFRSAPGFGRHRGGTHVLLDDGSVKFRKLTSSEADATETPYGPWQKLGTRNVELKHVDPDETLTASRRSLSSDWAVDYIQLISIDRYDQPRAYVQDEVPTMNQLASADLTMRSLNRFETDALALIQAGRQVVRSDVEGTLPSQSLFMVGAVRADTACLVCHDRNQGDVLDALTYRFTAARSELE